MVKGLKALAVKWTLYFGCNLLLDGKPEERWLVCGEAKALGRNSTHSFGHLFCSLKPFFERPAQHLRLLSLLGCARGQESGFKPCQAFFQGALLQSPEQNACQMANRVGHSRI
jgi:hypothetical protein